MSLDSNIVVFETTHGNFSIELYYNHAPKACQNMKLLANMGYYNGTIFHRVIQNFMIQGGDPTGTGRGGESAFGGYFQDEITPALRHTGAGIVSMANMGPNTNGSQFFITLAPTPWLDGKHTIIGRIHDGMEVIRSIGSVPTRSDVPTIPIKINKAYVKTFSALDSI